MANNFSPRNNPFVAFALALVLFPLAPLAYAVRFVYWLIRRR